MRQFGFLFFLLIVLLFNSSCSKHSTTEAKIKISLSNIIDTTFFQGGAIVAGYNITTGDSFTYVPNGTEDIVQLTNGIWKFTAIAWEGDASAEKAMTGTHRCDILTNVELKGGDIELNFVTDSSKCSSSQLANTYNGNQLHQLRFKSCHNFPETLAHINDCTPTDSNEGSVNSIRISLHGGSPSPNLSVPESFLTSRCVPKANFSATSIFVPTGILGIGIPTSIEYFSDSTCTYDTSTRNITYYTGLQSSPSFDSKLDLISNIPYFYFADIGSTSNVPPVLKVIDTAGADVSVDFGATYSPTALDQYKLAHRDARDSITNSDYDSGGQALSYSCIFDNTADANVASATDCSTISGLSFNKSTGEFIWIPDAGTTAGIYEFMIKATDGYFTASKFFSFDLSIGTVPSTVTQILNSNIDSSIKAGSTGTMLLYAADAAGNIDTSIGSTSNFTTNSSNGDMTITAGNAGNLVNGLAKVSFTGTVVGSYPLTLSSTDLAITDYALGSVAVTTGDIDNIKIVTTANSGSPLFSNTSIDPDTTLPFYAASFDAYGNYIADVMVNWSVNSNSLVLSAANPIENGSLSGGLVGTGALTAYFVDSHGVSYTDTTATITTNTGAASVVSLAVTGATSIIADGTSSTILEATVTDAGGNPVTGETVSAYTPSEGTLNTSAVTDANGHASFTLVSSTTAGSYSDFKVFISGPTDSKTVAVDFTSGPAANITLPTPGTLSVTADAAPTSIIDFFATVTDANGNSVAGASVSLDIPANGGTSAAVFTDGSGIAHLVLKSSKVAGTYSYTATVNGITSSAVTGIDFVPGAPASVKIVDGSSVEITTDTFVSGSYNNLYAAAYDINNNYIGDVDTGNYATTWSTSGSGTFDSPSIPMVQFGATIAGTEIVTVTSTGLGSDSTGNITIIAGSAAQVKIETAADGSGTEIATPSLTIGTSTLDLYAVERDTNGNFVGLASGGSWSLANGNGTLSSTTGGTVTFTPQTIGAEIISFTGTSSDSTGTISINSDLVAEINNLYTTLNSYVATTSAFTGIGGATVDNSSGKPVVTNIGNFASLIHPNYLDDGDDKNDFLTMLYAEEIGSQFQPATLDDITMIDPANNATNGELALVSFTIVNNGKTDSHSFLFKRDSADSGKYKIYGNQMPFHFYPSYTITQWNDFSTWNGVSKTSVKAGIDLQNMDSHHIEELYNSSTKELSGSVNLTNGNQTVSGTGTSFTTELAVNDMVSIWGSVYTVASITDNTTLTVSETVTTDASGADIRKVTTANNIRRLFFKIKDSSDLSTVFMSKEAVISYDSNVNQYYIGFDEDNDGEFCPSFRIQDTNSGAACYNISTPEGSLWEFSDSDINTTITSSNIVITIEYATGATASSPDKPYTTYQKSLKPYTQAQVDAVVFPKFTQSGSAISSVDYCKGGMTSDVTYGVNLEGMSVSHGGWNQINLFSISNSLSDNYDSENHEDEINLNASNEFVTQSFASIASSIGISDPMISSKFMGMEFHDSNGQKISVNMGCAYTNSLSSSQPFSMMQDGIPIGSVAFGQQVVNSTTNQVFTVKNESSTDISNIAWVLSVTGPFTVNSITCTGSASTNLMTPTTLAAGESCTFDISFSPVSPESWGSFDFMTSDEAMAIVLDLNGTPSTLSAVSINASSSSCPNGFIEVPADPSVGVSSNFCVMRYEASTVTSNGVFQAYTGSNLPSSNISQIDAKLACQNMGTGFDLISNAEWMAIARNIEAGSSNWSSGTVGTGCIFQGNTGTDNACGYNLGNVDVGYASDIKSKLTLSNNAGIWHFAGNLDEWVDWSLGGALESAPSATGTNSFIEITTALGGISAAEKESAGGYSSAQGVGMIYNTDTGDSAAVRGGYWTSGATNGGIYSLNISNNPSGVYTSVGFRCVFRP